jgi:hypothetical protein
MSVSGLVLTDAFRVSDSELSVLRGTFGGIAGVDCADASVSFVSLDVTVSVTTEDCALPLVDAVGSAVASSVIGVPNGLKGSESFSRIRGQKEPTKAIVLIFSSMGSELSMTVFASFSMLW